MPCSEHGYWRKTSEQLQLFCSMVLQRDYAGIRRHVRDKRLWRELAWSAPRNRSYRPQLMGSQPSIHGHSKGKQVTTRTKAIEAMAQYLVSTDERSARKTCAQLATIYEQIMQLRPDISTLKLEDKQVKVARLASAWEVEQ